MSRIGRGRRTRVYDCNYDKGESYYRPVLDRLDGKLPPPRESERERMRSDVDARIRSAMEDIEQPHAHSFASAHAHAQDDLYDSRGARALRGKPLAAAFDDDLDDEVTESLKRLRASKKSSRFAEDLDFDTTVSNMENRMRISDKILESVGVSKVSSANRALLDNEERTEKRITRRLNEESGGLTKWTALGKVDDESAAAQRAKVSRARLTDLEDEMSEMNERHAAREKRAARLRALVAENEAESDMSSSTATKVTFRAEREKKQVTF